MPAGGQQGDAAAGRIEDGTPQLPGLIGSGLLLGVLLWLVEGVLAIEGQRQHRPASAPDLAPRYQLSPHPAAGAVTYEPFSTGGLTATQRQLANATAPGPHGTYLRLGPPVRDFYASPAPAPPTCTVWREWNATQFWWHNEFGLELQIVLPYAWHLHQSCFALRSTGVRDTLPFYFFMHRHTENLTVLRQMLREDYSCCPIKKIHHPRSPGGVRSEWVPPPLKQLYANTFYRFSKPLLVILNKYQSEWGRHPLNYLSIEALGDLVDKLSPHYHIVYARPDESVMMRDGSRLYDLKEKEGLRRRGVTLIEDLWEQAQRAWRERMGYLSFNLLQLWVLANADRFIAVQGGNAVLAAYMAGPRGKVAVYVRRGHEQATREVQRWYGLFSGAEVTQHDSKTGLLAHVTATFLPPG
eukprot:TRINITY_DN28127_c0_g1_i1.p1 TRINITY_DN28127_c0_g1~~TRINITY_DN28127_c0_g1_i1.p1  ORF type:complete len:411 (+),score=135.29 TRINITY_DN28127_c0_g1_i1:63-1295(+)